MVKEDASPPCIKGEQEVRLSEARSVLRIMCVRLLCGAQRGQGSSKPRWLWAVRICGPGVVMGCGNAYRVAGAGRATRAPAELVEDMLKRGWLQEP